MKFIPPFVLRFVLLAATLFSVGDDPFGGKVAFAQTAQRAVPRLDAILRQARPLGSAALSFPGRFGGFMLAELPIRSIKEGEFVTPGEEDSERMPGDTLVRQAKFLLDLGVSGFGTVMLLDSQRVEGLTLAQELLLADGRVLRTDLTPASTRSELKQYDSLLTGVLGYGFLKQYTTAFDFRKNTITFYSLLANLEIGAKDTGVIELPLLDDAELTFCHCPFPTIWIEAFAKPLRSGRLHLGFAEPVSRIFTPALDEATLASLQKADKSADFSKGVGISVSDFRIKDATERAHQIATRNPRRIVQNLPPLFKDLSVPVLGTLGNDVLRTFSGLIIDPARNKVYLVK